MTARKINGRPRKSGASYRRSRRHIAENPNCAVCGGVADEVDHIHPWCKSTYDEWTDTFITPSGINVDYEENLQSICRGCHREKSITEHKWWVERNRDSNMKNRSSSVRIRSSAQANLKKAKHVDLMAARAQGMIGGGARWRDVCRILGGVSKSTLHGWLHRELDKNGKSAVRNRLERGATWV